MRNAIKIIFLTAAFFILTALCAYAGELAEYTAPDGVRYRVDYDNGVTAYCIDKQITKAEIPQMINGQAVKRVDFSNCAELVEAEIPEGITEFSFSGCTALSSVKMPEGISIIGEKAFYNCKALANIELPETLTVIRDEAFSGCSGLSSIKIPESVMSVDSEAFRGCKALTSLILPENVSYIGVGAFSDCTSLKKVEIQGEIKAISADTFSGCKKLASVVIPESVTEIRESAFQNCKSLKSVIISNGVTSIGTDAFHGCTALASVKLSNHLSYIGWGAFRDCKSLKTIKLPKSLTDIKANAFSGCTALKISVPQTVKSIGGYDYKTADFAPFYKVKSAEYKGKSTEAIKSAISPYMQKKTAHSITVKWTKFTKASAYKVYRYNHITKKWKLVKTIKNPNITSCKVTKLKAGKRYSFKVKVILGGKTYESILKLQRTARKG